MLARVAGQNLQTWMVTGLKSRDQRWTCLAKGSVNTPLLSLPQAVMHTLYEIPDADTILNST